MPMFSFPDKKLRENLGPIIKSELEKGKYKKEEDPVYLVHVKKVQKVLKKRFFWW